MQYLEKVVVQHGVHREGGLSGEGPVVPKIVPEHRTQGGVGSQGKQHLRGRLGREGLIKREGVKYTP
jgi:hypothetical protein